MLLNEQGEDVVGANPINESPERLGDNAADAGSEDKRPSGKRWCFTCYTDSPPVFNKEEMEYLIYQRELCPKTGKLHWQGFCCFAKKLKLGKLATAGVKKYLGATTHVEIARGSIRDNERYCSKKESGIEGTFAKFGNAPIEEPKFSYAQLREDCKSKKNMMEIVHDNFQLYVQHGTNVRNAVVALRPPPQMKRIVSICLFGSTGVGKTEWVKFQFHPDDVYFKMAGPWWDGYTGQQVVVFNDFYGEHRIGEMLNWNDMYPTQVEVKGGMVWLRHRYAIFTSNQDPREWWKKILDEKQDVRDAWNRRLPMSNCFHIQKELQYDEFGIAKKDFTIRVTSPGHQGLVRDTIPTRAEMNNLCTWMVPRGRERDDTRIEEEEEDMVPALTPLGPLGPLGPLVGNTILQADDSSLKNGSDLCHLFGTLPAVASQCEQP